MINALGLLEVDGMVAAVDAADAMLKAANVRLLSHEELDPGRIWRRAAQRLMPAAPPQRVRAVLSAVKR